MWWKRTWWTCKFWVHQWPQRMNPICNLCQTRWTRGPAPLGHWRGTRGQNVPFHATTHTAQCCSSVLQHPQEICKLECVFFMGFWCWWWAYVQSMPYPLETCKSPGGVWSEQCKSIHHITAGYDTCIKAMHKRQLPNMWQCMAEQVELKCLKPFVSEPTLYPTKMLSAMMSIKQ